MGCEGADVFTYGFSNRSWDETMAILRAYSIECLVDVRSLPGSKKFPHFNLENLEVRLPEAGLRYVHLKSLGGYRKSQNRGDENAGWRNSSFRNYADYMQSEEFEAGLQELIRL